MSTQSEQELERLLDAQASLEALNVHYQQPSVSLEAEDSGDAYLRYRRWNEVENTLGMEGLTLQTVRDSAAAAGRLALGMGRGFMQVLDAVHRTIDSTHLVRMKQLREKLRKVPSEDARIFKGRMERSKLANGLAIGGQLPSDLRGPTGALLDFSRRTGNTVLPDLASFNRQIAQRLESKRWMGTDVFADEVEELVKIIGTFKLPMQRYPEADFQRLFPGDRTIFTSVKPRHPRQVPTATSGAVRKLVDGVSHTTVGLRGKAGDVRGRAEAIVPILTIDEAFDVLEMAEKLLQEALRIKNLSKGFGKDRMPSTMSLMLSGLIHGVKKQIDDVWTAQDDGFDVIEGAHQGGQVVRHKPGTRSMLGGLVQGGATIVPGMEALDDNERFTLASWTVQYLRLPLLDQQKTSQSLVLLLVGVARTYLDYVEESYDYYT